MLGRGRGPASASRARRRSFHGPDEDIPERLGHGGVEREVDGLLVREMCVESALRYARDLDDVADCGARIALLGRRGCEALKDLVPLQGVERRSSALVERTLPYGHSTVGYRRMKSPSRVAACALLLLVVAPAAAHAKDLAAHPGAIKGVSAEYRPEFRWWWPTDGVDPAELRAELRAVKRAGFGGIEQALLANGTEWGSPAFRARTRDAVREANRLGLGFDVTLGPGWPVSSPGTDDLDREASMQDLHYGAVDLQGPTTYSGPVPDRAPPDAGRRRLIAVTAMRMAAGGTPQVLDPGLALDLTSRVTNGSLTWQVPQGSWKLFGFWMRPTLMRAKTSGGLSGLAGRRSLRARQDRRTPSATSTGCSSAATWGHCCAATAETSSRTRSRSSTASRPLASPRCSGRARCPGVHGPAPIRADAAAAGPLRGVRFPGRARSASEA